ncbi:MAG: hypothetical protein J3K34DRAFT_432033 [Monoraphidium minutum]|nr:MAG: hypothetical protein J3K34DRAFT_432033 [Monoraphidium minutum]
MVWALPPRPPPRARPRRAPAPSQAACHPAPPPGAVTLSGPTRRRARPQFIATGEAEKTGPLLARHGAPAPQLMHRRAPPPPPRLGAAAGCSCSAWGPSTPCMTLSCAMHAPPRARPYKAPTRGFRTPCGASLGAANPREAPLTRRRASAARRGVALGRPRLQQQHLRSAAPPPPNRKPQIATAHV